MTEESEVVATAAESGTDTPSAEPVTVTVDDGIADIRLNRGEKRNAIDMRMLETLAVTGESMKSAAGLRAVVLSGVGPDFCAGLDFAEFHAMQSGRVSQSAQTVPPTGPAGNVAQHAVTVWTEVPVPVIVAIHGNALGAGLQIALGADIRLVSPGACLGVLEVVWGLVPDMAGTQLLPELVGRDVAKELTFTGRIVVGEEAARLGLATRVCADPLAEAFDLARSIAGHSPHAVRAAKRLIEKAGRTDIASGLVAEREEVSALLASPNQIEAITAKFAERQPRFTDVSTDAE